MPWVFFLYLYTCIYIQYIVFFFWRNASIYHFHFFKERQPGDYPFSSAASTPNVSVPAVGGGGGLDRHSCLFYGLFFFPPPTFACLSVSELLNINWQQRILIFLVVKKSDKSNPKVVIHSDTSTNWWVKEPTSPINYIAFDEFTDKKQNISISVELHQSYHPPLSLPSHCHFLGCGAVEATGLSFVCFVVINPRVFSANRVVLGFFCFKKVPILPLPPSHP